jgi:hypothetical protein
MNVCVAANVQGLAPVRAFVIRCLAFTAVLKFVVQSKKNVVSKITFQKPARVAAVQLPAFRSHCAKPLVSSRFSPVLAAFDYLDLVCRVLQ